MKPLSATFIWLLLVTITSAGIYSADGNVTFTPSAVGEFGYEFVNGSGYRPYFFIDIPSTEPGTTCTMSPRRIFVKTIPWLAGPPAASTQYSDQVLLTFDNFYAMAQAALSTRKHLFIGYDCDTNNYAVLPIDSASPYSYMYWMTIK